MKKLLIFLGVLIVLILASAVIIPFVFKDQIRQQVDLALQENINADVYYDSDQFDLGFFDHFPNLTAGLGHFGIVGKGVFEGDTLISVDRFEININPFKLISGNQVNITSVYLIRPDIQLLTLEDGTVNYDITYPDEGESDEQEETTEEYTISVNQWVIEQGRFLYNDLKYKVFLAADGIEHTGSGDITLSEYDLNLQADVDKVFFDYEGDRYLSGQRFTTDMLMHIDMEAFQFTFKDNQSALNDFDFTVDGSFAMPEEDIDFDMSFSTPDNSFKSLLSLIPDLYQSEDFEKLLVEGNLSFDGKVSGTYSDELYPGLEFNLKVADGKVQYPDLAESIQNIQMDFSMRADQGDYSDLQVDLRHLTANFGENPFEMELKTAGLHPIEVETRMKGQLSLAEINQMIPMEGMQLEGLLDLDLEASGVYDSIAQTIPQFNGTLSLSNGLVQYQDFPKPVKEINMTAKLSNTTGKLADSYLELDPAKFYIAEELMTLKAKFWNLDNYHWDMTYNGTLDLALINQVYPIEQTYLAGILQGNIQSKGNYQAVEQEDYTKLQTSGSLQLTDFLYVDSTYLPQGFAISTSNLSFTPQSVNLRELRATSGVSDFNLDGEVSNYLGYALNDDILRGSLTLKSQLVNVNELMAQTETEEATGAEDSAALEAVRVPENISFAFNSTIDKLIYETYELKNVVGKVRTADGKVYMENFRFNMLEGTFAMNGYYNSVPRQPYIDFELDIEEVSIPAAATTFTFVSKAAPIARNMEGKFGTDFRISGSLQEDMTPVYESLTGGGMIRLVNASITDSPVLQGITSATGFKNTDDLSLENIEIEGEVRDGRFLSKPFDVKMGSYKATIEGSNSFAGDLDYQVAMDVPAAAAGDAANQLISNYIGANNVVDDEVTIKLDISGNYDDPQVGIADVGAGGAARSAITEKKQEVKEQVKEEAAQVKDSIQAKVEDEKEKAKEEVKEEAKEKVDELKNKAKKLFGGGN